MSSALLAGTQHFRRQEFPPRKQRFQELAGGQKPAVLFITCSDSRIAPHLITHSEPGDIFVIRNAGNIVPPHVDAPGGEQATIEYAVAVLGVEHIVVCGHSDCGAMKGLLAPESLKSVPSVADWLDLAKSTREQVEKLHPSSEGAERLARTIEVNTREQLKNLKSHPSVAKALEEKRLTLHAWVYDIGSGGISAAKGDEESFAEINDLSAPESNGGR